MLTLADVFNNLARFDAHGTRIAGVSLVRAVSLRVGYSKSIQHKGSYIVRTICRTSTPRPGQLGNDDYVTTIDFYDPKGHVKLSCSCPDFWSRFEYSLARKGSADIQYSNGEPPIETNPRHIAAACKHVVKMTHVLQDHGYVNKTYNWIPQQLKKK